MLPIDFNIIAFGLTSALIVFGLIFGENRIRTITFGAFVSLFVLSQAPNQFFVEISNKGFFGFHPDPTDCRLILLGLLLVLFFAASLIGGGMPQKNIRSVVLSVLTSLFVLGFGIAMLPESSVQEIITNYNIASMIYTIRFYVLFAIVIWLVIIHFSREKKPKRRRKRKK